MRVDPEILKAVQKLGYRKVEVRNETLHARRGADHLIIKLTKRGRVKGVSAHRDVYGGAGSVKVSNTSNNFFSESEKAVFLLMMVQRALGSQQVSKKYIAQTLSKHGLDHEQALESLERKGYIVSVGYERSYVALTTKGKNVGL